jgi:hypothetical protein
MRRHAAVGIVALSLLAGVGPCEEEMGFWWDAYEVSWSIQAGGQAVSCAYVGAVLVRLSVRDAADGRVYSMREPFCSDGGGAVEWEAWPAPVVMLAELVDAGGRTLEQVVVPTEDLKYGQAEVVFEMAGVAPPPDAAVPDAAPPDAATGCVPAPGDPSRVTAVATIGGKVVRLEPTCAYGEVRQAIGWETVSYPVVIAFRGAGPSWASLFLVINPDRAGATATCDDREVEFGMTGAGTLRFESSDGIQVQSARGGSFAVHSYAATAGARVAGSFDCPVPGGAVSGSFDVRLH